MRQQVRSVNRKTEGFIFFNRFHCLCCLSLNRWWISTPCLWTIATKVHFRHRHRSREDPSIHFRQVTPFLWDPWPPMHHECHHDHKTTEQREVQAARDLTVFILYLQKRNPKTKGGLLSKATFSKSSSVWINVNSSYLLRTHVFNQVHACSICT